MKFTRFVYAMTVEIHAIRICDDRVEPGGGARDDATVTGTDVRQCNCRQVSIIVVCIELDFT